MFRPSRDAIFNLHELAMDSEFIQDIHTFPDLSVIMFDHTTISIFQSLLCRSDPISLPIQLLSYDTTFNMGDFYLSVLLFRQTDFVEQPVVPLAYLIHERKLLATHSFFFTKMASICPEIDTATNIIMVTDSEQAIRQSLKNAFPNLRVYLCWNHILKVSSNVQGRVARCESLPL
jgi:hypothetical protein